MAQIDFSGRVAIVTGAGAGLGRMHSIELAKRGCKVVVNDLGSARDGAGASHSAADHVVDEIKAAGGQAVANYDNVATTAGGESIVKTAIDAFGKVDILINNAGILRDKSFGKMEEENWDIVMAVHLRGAFCVTKPAFNCMRDQGYGRIVMTTSGAGLFGNFGQANYAAAKMGIIGLTNVLKLEGAKHNIKTNVIAPIAASRLTEDVMPPQFFEKLKPDFITPMVLVCGVFFPADQLPGLVQAVAAWLPLTHAVSLIRPLLLGEIPGAIGLHLGALLVVAVAAFCIASVLIRRRLLK